MHTVLKHRVIEQIPLGLENIYSCLCLSQSQGAQALICVFLN